MNVLGTRKKCYRKEKCDIRKSLIVTFNDLRGHTLFNEILCLHNVSIHRNFYQNQFINESVRKGLVNAKIG